MHLQRTLRSCSTNKARPVAHKTGTLSSCQLKTPCVAHSHQLSSHAVVLKHSLAQTSSRRLCKAFAASEAQLAEPSQERDEGREFAVAVAKIADETKCQDITVLHVAPLVSWTSYKVFCSVFSRPQLLATIARVEQLADQEFSRTRSNQPGTSPWECLDYGDVVVHVMTAEQREYYNVEEFYAAAEEVDLPFAAQPPAEAPPKWTTQF